MYHLRNPAGPSRRRLFFGLALREPIPDHSTISRTPRPVDLETRGDVFGYVLKVLAIHDLVSGKLVGVGSTTLDFGELRVREFIPKTFFDDVFEGTW